MNLKFAILIISYISIFLFFLQTYFVSKEYGRTYDLLNVIGRDKLDRALYNKFSKMSIKLILSILYLIWYYYGT